MHTLAQSDTILADAKQTTASLKQTVAVRTHDPLLPKQVR